MTLQKLLQILQSKSRRPKPKSNHEISSPQGADLCYGANLGQWGEAQAAHYLIGQGWTILEQNWQNRFGEGDIVAREADTIILVEVKTKNSLTYGDPIEMVTPAKQRKLQRLGLRLTQRYNMPVRIDVITILRQPSGKIVLRHYPHAIQDQNYDS